MKEIYAVCCGPFTEYIFICGDSLDIIHFRFADNMKASNVHFQRDQKELFTELSGHTRYPT